MGTNACCSLLLAVCALSACATQPSSRLEAYLGSSAAGGGAITVDRVSVPAGPLEAGLLIINDTTAPDSSPMLSASAKAYLANQIKARVEGALPVRIVAILDPRDVAQGQSRPDIGQMSRDQGASYLLLAVVSNAESEVPLRLPLTGDPEQGGGRPGVSGFEMRTNALAELALLDTASGRLVARAEGQAWNRLNRLYVPIQSNSYPVIHRSLRVAPIYPKEENAKDIARSLAGDEAVEQAVYQLQELWRKPGA